jgi:alpha-tubulin suppressor-like RCC1 family protein
MGHSLALKNDGSLWAWGLNGDGQLGDGTTNSRSVPTMIGTDRDWGIIAAGYSTSFALKNNGTLWCWGEMGTNNNLAPKQIGSGTNWLAISAFDVSFVALKTDGTLWQENLTANRLAVGFFSVLPTGNFTQIGLDRDWSEVYAGEIPLFYARKKDGSWWVGGKDYWRQLGLGISIPALPSPQHLPFDFEPWAFATGNGTTLLLGKDGKLWTWGKRLGAGKPSATWQKIQALLAPMVRRFPSLGYLIKSDIDQTPHLLWELPPEVRRALGTGPKSSTNNLTAGHSADTLHE